MPNDGFGDGPYHLSPRTLDSIVTRNGPGTFVLGQSTEAGFQIDFVGRSDDDIHARLQLYVGKYRHFRFDYLPSAKAAYLQECALFHDFTPRDNARHPSARVGSGWTCPRCEAVPAAARRMATAVASDAVP